MTDEKAEDKLLTFRKSPTADLWIWKLGIEDTLRDKELINAIKSEGTDSRQNDKALSTIISSSV